MAVKAAILVREVPFGWVVGIGLANSLGFAPRFASAQTPDPGGEDAVVGPGSVVLSKSSSLASDAVTWTCSNQSISKLALFNSDTSAAIPGDDPIPNGATILASSLAASGNLRYWLQAIETTGATTEYGPASTGAYPASAVFLPFIAR